MKLLCLHSVANRWFLYLGKSVGKYPHWFSIFPFIISIILSTGIIKIQVNRDLNNLFAASNGQAQQETKLVDNLFETNSSDFAQIFRLSKVADMNIVQAIAKDMGSVFRKRVFDEIVALERLVTTFSTTWEGKSLNYSMICGKRYNKCIENKVLELASYIKDDKLEKHSVKYPIDINHVTFSLKEYVFFLGGVETDQKDYVKDAKAIRFVYTFDLNNHSKLAAIKHWIKGVNLLLSKTRFEYIDHALLNTELIREELQEMSITLLHCIPIVAIAILIFAFFSSMTDNWIRSKPLVGAASCFSALLAFASAFGLCLHFDISYTDYHLLVAFCTLATEVDDAFILIASWRKSNPKHTVVERMRQTYSGTGISITITSATNIISYCIGIFTPFPVVRLICIYAAVSTFFSYLYLITFFGGCLALDGYRERKEKNPLTFMCSKDVKTSSLCKDGSFEEEYFMRKFREIIGLFLNRPFVKLIIGIVFFTNLATSLWGLTFIEYGNEVTDAFGTNSMCRRAINWNYKYFNMYSSPIHVVINRPLNYADPKIQIALDDLMEKLETHPHIADSDLRISWLKYYKLFLNSIAARYLLHGYNMSNKAEFIDGLHNIFFKFHQARQFQEDVVFNENHTEIIASRFLILTTNITDTSTELQLKDYVHRIADQSPLPVQVHSIIFLLIEQAQLIKATTLMTSIVASCLIFLVFFMFVPNFICSLCVFAVVICMFCETVGYMSLWGVKLDISSLITLVICVGFSINYPTHISISYVNSKNMKPDDRVCNALYEVGMPIFQGMVSTILGISALAFPPYYGFRSCFKVVFLMSLQTAFHSLFFIPVLLSVLGHCDQTLSVEKKKPNSEADTKLLEMA